MEKTANWKMSMYSYVFQLWMKKNYSDSLLGLTKFSKKI